MYRYKSRRDAYAEHLKNNPDQCPFCDLENSDNTTEKRQIVKVTDHALIVENIFPYDLWEGLAVQEHLMIVPKRHVGMLNELSDDERQDIMSLICEYGSRDYDVFNRAPSSKIRSVAHLHFHLIKTTGNPARHIEFDNTPYDLRVTW